MNGQFIAHTPNKNSGEWHRLADHLDEVGRRAANFGRPLGLEASARLVGRLHDLGKYSDEFQRYLRDAAAANAEGRPSPRRRIDHKSAGAATAHEQLLGLLALPILGHHGGLPDRAEARRVTEVDVASGLSSAALAEAGDFLPAAGDIVAAKAEFAALASSEIEAELMLRLVYSCLVDADSLDTEAHFESERAARRGGNFDIAELEKQLLSAQQALLAGAEDTLVNQARRSVYEDCLAAAKLPPGVFRLTVPTGGGKTRSSLAFALRHAALHGLSRVIYAVPFTSIIEQTAEVFRSVFEDPRAVLEHHSAVDDSNADGDSADWRVLTAENWDAPIVVTTTVQLFESLFANRPARCRKVHNIARSVIILDEVQTLPPHLLAPILDVLCELAVKYGTTVVLCTATQPAVDASPYVEGLSGVREIVTRPADHFKRLARVAYTIETREWTWQEAAQQALAHETCLVVVNTKKDAVRLLEEMGDPDALHLSTRLCPAHRKEVLDEVRARLSSGIPCRLVSTQVIEAGVDVDFPVAFRAMGPLDRIVQTAGRCNREGRLAQGNVVVFSPVEGSAPRGAYKTATDRAQMTLADDSIDLHDPDTFVSYFRDVYRDVETDRHGIQALRRSFDFPEVALRFRMIDDDTVSVLVPFDKSVVASICDEAARIGRVTREAWRKAQRHSVAMLRREFASALQGGLAYEVVAGSGLFRWTGEYSGVLGITGSGTDPADLVY